METAISVLQLLLINSKGNKLNAIRVAKGMPKDLIPIAIPIFSFEKNSEIVEKEKTSINIPPVPSKKRPKINQPKEIAEQAIIPPLTLKKMPKAPTLLEPHLKTKIPVNKGRKIPEKSEIAIGKAAST